MFKLIAVLFTALLAVAFAAPKPGYLATSYSSPIVAAAPVAYSAGYAAPVAYSAGYATPVAYSGGYAAPAVAAYHGAAYSHYY